ncbi:hypothetical protein GMPD_23180 [Geomonas paludis]|uniref:Glycosyltransferase RgtA/B/C/D-like domain-containing protein n=1 Tax=Geomonas paludis TaxID=2740185 RepID=A0A6V8MYZ2_9BACT|nr:hypothetical protein GMPD_23180 [Geomonas paludis]
MSTFPPQILTAAFAAVCGFVTFKLLAYHLNLVLFPWPIQLRETANLLSTSLLLKGGNPYALVNQPLYTNVYGLLYNLVTYPVAALFGPTLAVHKSVAGVFTLGCCLVTYWMLRGGGVTRTLSWSGSLVVYIALLVGKTSLAEPDSLGLFFYLLTIAIAVRCNFSRWGLAASGLAGIAGFYTKPYFILGIPLVAFYLVLFVNRKKGILYTIGTASAFILSAVAVSALCETYFYNTFLIHRNVAGKDVNLMLMQWATFGRQLTEVLAALSIAVCAMALSVLAARRGRVGAPAADGQGKSPLSPLRKGGDVRPLSPHWMEETLTPRNSLMNLGHGGDVPGTGQSPVIVSLPLFALVLVACVFTFKLGLHDGAYMTYLYQLVAPLFVLSVFPLLDRAGAWSYLILPLLALNLLRTSAAYSDLDNAFGPKDRANWEKAATYVSSHRNVLNSAAVAPLLFAQGKPLYDSGQSQYFSCGLEQPPPFGFLFPRVEEVRGQSARYREDIVAAIKAKKFDLLMLDRSFSKWIAPEELFPQYYTHRDVVTLYMPHMGYHWQIDIWEPKQ